MGFLISHNQLGHEIIRAYSDRATDGEILDKEELARLRFVTLSINFYIHIVTFLPPFTPNVPTIILVIPYLSLKPHSLALSLSTTSKTKNPSP